MLSYAVDVPGQEQALPAWAAMWSQHLYCTLHSAVIAGATTRLLRRRRRTLGLPLAGWWLHIISDVLTHSAEFYPVSVLYPLTYRGFDGLAWNAPWFMVANYLALAACCFALGRRQRSADADSGSLVRVRPPEPGG